MIAFTPMGLLGFAVEMREIALSMMSKRPANENKNGISEKSSCQTLEREREVRYLGSSEALTKVWWLYPLRSEQVKLATITSTHLINSSHTYLKTSNLFLVMD